MNYQELSTKHVNHCFETKCAMNCESEKVFVGQDNFFKSDEEESKDSEVIKHFDECSQIKLFCDRCRRGFSRATIKDH